jgi:hypothetical protein
MLRTAGLSIPFFTLSKHVQTLTRDTPFASRNTSSLAVNRTGRTTSLSDASVVKSSGLVNPSERDPEKASTQVRVRPVAETAIGIMFVQLEQERYRPRDIQRLKKRLQQLGGELNAQRDQAKVWRQGSRARAISLLFLMSAEQRAGRHRAQRWRGC